LVSFLLLTNQNFLKSSEQKQELQNNLRWKIEGKYKEYEQEQANYKKLTEERERQYLDYDERDKKSAKEIDTQMRKIQTLNVIDSKCVISFLSFL
jgi:nicotinamide riboside kinase